MRRFWWWLTGQNRQHGQLYAVEMQDCTVYNFEEEVLNIAMRGLPDGWIIRRMTPEEIRRYN